MACVLYWLFDGEITLGKECATKDFDFDFEAQKSDVCC